jgi:hypothetical protein
LGLFYVHRYRFLMIAQFARVASLSPHHAEDLLHSFARRGIVGLAWFKSGSHVKPG